MTQSSYYSHGKLLLSGEFLVLEGATALALPLKFGQKLSITEGGQNDTLEWSSIYEGDEWFSAKFDTKELELVNATDEKRGRYIQKLLQRAAHYNHLFINKTEGKKIITELEFDPEWGWGSSSTLISNIAFWSETNPFDLFFDAQEGSAYDIACARAETSILYGMNGNDPFIKEVKLKSAITPFLYFVYLGQKKDTEEGIRNYRQSRVFDMMDVQSISEIAADMLTSNDIQEFETLMNEHERIISKVIRQKPVKEELFADFPGEVKSLGTWGGDFIMMTYSEGKDKLLKYLESKNLDRAFSYSEIAL